MKFGLMSGASMHGVSVDSIVELARRAEEHVKGMIAPGTLFEEFGFHYYGPIDGHDLDALIPTLDNLRKLIKEKVVSAPFHCQFVLGVPGALSGEMRWASIQ